MDFFQAQDHARRKTKFLVLYFVAAVISIVAVIYAVTVVVWHQVEQSQSGDVESVPIIWWQPATFAVVTVCTLAVILLGSLFKTLALRAGGGAVARSLGGVKVDPNTTNPGERRLLNVVEEMAIASGVRIPDVYVLPEPAINAFAAGWSPDDAAIAVTQGTLQSLTRDELQGVIAHEFSHVLNGDMRTNIRLIGLLFGILLLAVIGRTVLRTLRFSRPSGGRSKNSGGIVAVMLILGLTLLIVGYVGLLFGRLIQAAISRQREFLADASAVQFTRNPPGITGALKKVGGSAAGSRILNAHATETSHLFFVNALSSAPTSAFATHPPLADRIRAIDPQFDGKFPAFTAPAAPFGETADVAPRAASRRPPPLSPERFITAIATAGAIAEPAAGATLLASIPEPLRTTARDPGRVRALTLALLAETSDAAAGRRQSIALGQTLTPAEVQAGAAAVPLLAGLDINARLALVDLALPALRTLPAASIADLLAAIDQMALADYRVTPFEFAIQHVLRRNLRAAAHLPPPLGAPAGTPQAGPDDVAAVLAVLARAGTSRPGSAPDAFARGARHFGLSDDRLGDRAASASSLSSLAVVLQRLERVPAPQKKKLLESLAVAASADGLIEPDEVALLRAFAAALDCPAPVLQAA